jgi:nitrogen fixation/metabolism regulation signal transduction histidine kinase
MNSLSHERRVLLLALAAGFPGTLLAVILLRTGGFTPKASWTLAVLVVLLYLGFAFAVRRRVRYPLQTISNLLGALREGDYSIRARGTRSEDALAEVARELNALGETLREQRLGALEATALLRKVMEEIDVAIFTFDGKQRLKFINRAGENMLARPAERVLGLSAAELGLQECLNGEPVRTIEMTFSGCIGRWGLRRSTFREGGIPHQLLVLTDVSGALREEERQAWQRLIRVIGHELNNSLAPIKSMAEWMEDLLLKSPRPADWEEDMHRGLHVVGARAEALSRFMKGYAQLARLPQPKLAPLEIAPWICQVARLETRVPVQILPGPNVIVQADRDQLEQLLINLLRNAADAARETSGGVSLSWSVTGRFLELWVEDEGPGISNMANLFVPFFTTKPGGSGIGLVLCRQIAEAHGGSVTLENRKDARGCRACVRLPVDARAQMPLVPELALPSQN